MYSGVWRNGDLFTKNQIPISTVGKNTERKKIFSDTYPHFSYTHAAREKFGRSVNFLNRAGTLARSPIPHSPLTAHPRRANADGDFHFKYITHTLACTACINSGIAQRCIHNLGNLPAWKSIMKLAQIKRIYPKKQQREFETEVLGIPEDTAEGYIDSALLDALREKPRFVPEHGERFPEVWVGVDPLSHGRSEMGLAAIAYSSRGEKVVLGAAAVPTRRPMLVEVRAAINVFLGKLRDHPGAAMAIIVPIVEWYGAGHSHRAAPRPAPPVRAGPHTSHRARSTPTPTPTPTPTHTHTHSNNNEVYAHELVRAFDAFPPLNNPWNRAAFDKNIAPNIGVYTTQETKLEALSELLASLLKNQVVVSQDFFTVGAEAFNPKEDPAEPEEQIEVLCDQLKNFTDHDDGSISGKSAGNEDDGRFLPASSRLPPGFLPSPPGAAKSCHGSAPCIILVGQMQGGST
jgi:hypothetical protein